MSKTAFEGSRRSLFLLTPEEVVIIGLDTEDGPSHPLYDERIHLPLAEMTVLDIMNRGVIEPIVVKKDGDRAIVTDGRRRVMHAREVNRRVKAAGGTNFVKIPVLPPEKGTDGVLMGLMIALNEHREEDTPINRAKKIQRYLHLGHSDAETAQTFKMSESTLKNTLSLLDLVPEVQALVVSGDLGLTRAYSLAKLESSKQIAAVQERSVAKTAQKKTPGKRTLDGIVKFGKGKVSDDFLLGIKYVLGQVDASEVPGLTDVLNPEV